MVLPIGKVPIPTLATTSHIVKKKDVLFFFKKESLTTNNQAGIKCMSTLTHPFNDGENSAITLD